MSSLFAALNTTADSMDVLQRAMGVVQNNVANASTPGYATQSLNIEARLFDPGGNQWGGITSTGLTDSRSSLAEQAVWTQNELLGSAAQSASSLSALQATFNVTGTSGIPGALSSLQSALSAWSSNPNDGPSQQQVLNAAQGLSQAFNTAAHGIDQLSTQTDQQLQSTVTQINALSEQIAQINQGIRRGDQNDPGLQAQLYNTLEQLSNLTSISAETESDGTVTVRMDGGQTPLVTGATANELSVQFLPADNSTNPNAPPLAHLIASNGQDITSSVSDGQIAALLDFRNTTIPSLTGDGVQQGSLNQLAQSIADQVNTLLTGGQTSSGAPGVPLFTYTSGLPTGVASTLALSPSITGSQLAAVEPGSPPGANGTADQLAQLFQQQIPALGNMTFTDFYSSVAAAIGNQESNASAAQQTQKQLLSQAQSARAQLEGVSLNDQATMLMQFQQGYEAAAQMISVVNNTMQYLMQMMEQV